MSAIERNRLELDDEPSALFPHEREEFERLYNRFPLRNRAEEERVQELLRLVERRRCRVFKGSTLNTCPNQVETTLQDGTPACFECRDNLEDTLL